MQSFRRLAVWRRAHALALNVRRATRSFPRRGYSSLTKQVTDAAESIPFNIVEGCGASTQREFARFLDISIKSTMELEYQLQLAHDNDVLPTRLWRELTQEAIEIRMMLCGLRKSVLAAAQQEDEDRKRKKRSTSLEAAHALPNEKLSESISH
jgi:four helix bundle protein